MAERRPSLTGLPQELQSKILKEVSNNNLKDAWRAKIACKSFNNIKKNPDFLKDVSMFNSDMGSYMDDGIFEYMRACMKAGNLEAMLLVGVTGFMYDDFNYPAQGLESIKSAGKGGCEFAKYVYEIIHKRLWVGEMNATDIDELSRDTAHEIWHKIMEMPATIEQVYDLGIHTGHVAESLHDIGEDFLEDCKCATYYNWRNIEDPSVKDLEMCDNCFWKIETIVMCRLMPKRFIILPTQLDGVIFD